MRLLGVLVDDGAVARELQRDLLGGLALHLDLLLEDAHRLEALAMAVAIGPAFFGLVDVDILLIGREDGKAEGDLAVMADRDAGHGRLPCPDGVEAGRREMHEVAQGRHRMGAVRIIGEDRPAARGAAAVDHPVVRAGGGEILDRPRRAR